MGSEMCIRDRLYCIDYILSSKSINNYNNIERLTYIGRSIQNILKTLNSELSVLILYLCYRFSVFFLGLLKRIPYRKNPATISRRLQILENNNFIRLVGENEFSREKEVWKYNVSRCSKNPDNADRIKFYTLTDFGKIVVKTFLKEIEEKIKPYIGRINELKDAFLRDLKLLKVRAERTSQKSQYYRCENCGLSFEYQIAVRNQFRCNRCGKPLKPVGGKISYTVSDTLIEGEKMRGEFLSREEKIVLSVFLNLRKAGYEHVQWGDVELECKKYGLDSAAVNKALKSLKNKGFIGDLVKNGVFYFYLTKTSPNPNSKNILGERSL